MRTAIVILLSGALLGVSPQQEIASLKIQVKSLERQLVMARAQADKAGGPILRVPNAPREYWSDADLFAEHIKLRDILGIRKPDESPAAWLKRNKGFVGRAVTWRGAVLDYVSHAAGRVGGNVQYSYNYKVAAGQRGILILQVRREKRYWKLKMGVSVIAKGTIEGINIQPMEIKDGQVVHGAIVVHVKGALQEARTTDKR